MKKKNILAENMIRFGSKNLDESNKTSLKKLMEQDNEAQFSKYIGQSLGQLGMLVREYFVNPDTNKKVSELKDWIISNIKPMKNSQGQLDGLLISILPNESGSDRPDDLYYAMKVSVTPSKIMLGAPGQNPLNEFKKFNTEFVKKQQQFKAYAVTLGDGRLGNKWSFQKSKIRSFSDLKNNDILKQIQKEIKS